MTMRALISEKTKTPPAKQVLAEVKSPNSGVGLGRLPSNDERKITRCVDLSARGMSVTVLKYTKTLNVKWDK